MWLIIGTHNTINRYISKQLLKLSISDIFLILSFFDFQNQLSHEYKMDVWNARTETKTKTKK
jgi:hypothetical protein